MCQAHPGQRCAADAKKIAASSQQRLRIAEQRGNEAQIDLMRRNLRQATVDFYSTRTGQAESMERCTTPRTTVLEHDGRRWTLTTALDEHGQTWQVATNDAGVPVYVDGQPPAERVAGYTQAPTPRQLWDRMREPVQEIATERALAREGWVLRAARDDQVALMPTNPGRGNRGYVEYRALADARDDLARAEARFAVAVMTGTDEGKAEAGVLLRGADQAVRTADRDYRLATGSVSPRTAHEALKPGPQARELKVRAVAGDDAEREAALTVLAEYESDRGWATFGRPQYDPREVENRPAAPWVHLERPVCPADISRVYLMSGLVPTVSREDGKTTLILQVPGRSAENAALVQRLWAGGYWTRNGVGAYERSGRCEVVSGPDLPRWAASRRTATRAS